MLMAINERYGLGYDHHLRYDEQTWGVTAAAVQDVAARYLAPAGLVEVVVGAKAGREKSS